MMRAAALEARPHGNVVHGIDAFIEGEEHDRRLHAGEDDLVGDRSTER